MPNSKIRSSICEFSLIEYADFLAQFKYLTTCDLKVPNLTPSLWPLTFHGQNAEMIHFLEDTHVELKDKSYKQVFYESIKCNRNNIAKYFINNFYQNDEENSQDTI